MTAQIGDGFRLKGRGYSLVAISHPLNFDPREYGITPQAACTACWNGFWCVYNVTEDGLFLEDLYINSEGGYYPEIEGVKALSEEKGQNTYMGHHLYKGLNIKVPYSGRILVGDEFIRDYYVHMGYQAAWAYEILTELVFEKGALVATNDQSGIAADLREKIDRDEDFDLDYEMKVWWL